MIPWDAFLLFRGTSMEIASIFFDRFREHQTLKVTCHSLKAHNVLSASKVLIAARTLQATDDKDKVYGLFGILKQVGVALSHPDYSNSVAQISTEATFAVVVFGNCLDVVFQGIGSTPLCHWICPYRYQTGAVVWGLNLTHPQHIEGVDWENCGKCPEYGAPFLLGSDGSIRVKGIIVDAIRHCSPSYLKIPMKIRVQHTDAVPYEVAAPYDTLIS
jgi:hypothetical protein